MNSLALLLACFQAYLVQSVLSQCLSKYGPAIAPAAPIAPYAGLGTYGYGEVAYPAAGYAGIGCGEAYGGIGEGNVAVAGELPVAGTTAVTGQVPVMGAVKFGGDVCAGGAVNIAGKCASGCGCGYDSPYRY